MADIEEHLRQVHSDPDRDTPSGDCPRLDPKAPPTTPLECEEPTFLEVKEDVRKARAGSAPRPNKMPYNVYKMCPLLLRRLWNLLKVIWRKGKIPEEWQHAENKENIHIAKTIIWNNKDITQNDKTSKHGTKKESCISNILLTTEEKLFMTLKPFQIYMISTKMNI